MTFIPHNLTCCIRREELQLTRMMELRMASESLLTSMIERQAVLTTVTSFPRSQLRSKWVTNGAMSAFPKTHTAFFRPLSQNGSSRDKPLLDSHDPFIQSKFKRM